MLLTWPSRFARSGTKPAAGPGTIYCQIAELFLRVAGIFKFSKHELLQLYASAIDMNGFIRCSAALLV